MIPPGGAGGEYGEGGSAGESAGEQAFRAVRALLSSDCAETRRAVRAVAPWLLDAYLEMRATRR